MPQRLGESSVFIEAVDQSPPKRRDFPIFFKPLEPSGYYMYHLLYHTKTRHYAHTLHFRVPYESDNKQRLFPQTALTGWSL
jgi:hypothetical protein